MRSFLRSLFVAMMFVSGYLLAVYVHWSFAVNYSYGETINEVIPNADGAILAPKIVRQTTFNAQTYEEPHPDLFSVQAGDAK